MTLVLTGSSHGETEPKKVTYFQAGHNKTSPTSLEKDFLSEEAFPPNFFWISVRVTGIQWLKWLHLKEQNNLTKGTNKNTYEVLGKVEPLVG